MSNNYSGNPAFGELFLDAAREAIDRSRIKAQMNRIQRIIKVDKGRIRNLYAEIGVMYCEGDLSEENAKYKALRANIEKLEQRVARAKNRYEMLKAAHSVDECTEAFKSELQQKVKSAQTATAEKAREVAGKAKVVAKNVTDKAKDVAADYSDKASDAFADVKRKVAVAATDAADKAKEVVENIAARAADTVEMIRGGGIDGEDLVYTIDEETDDFTEDVAETVEPDAEAEDMLKRISATLESVDAEEPAEEVPAEEVPAEETPAEESAESFDF